MGEDSFLTITSTNARHFDRVGHLGVRIVIWVIDDMTDDAWDDWSLLFDAL